MPRETSCFSVSGPPPRLHIQEESSRATGQRSAKKFCDSAQTCVIAAVSEVYQKLPRQLKTSGVEEQKESGGGQKLSASISTHSQIRSPPAAHLKCLFSPFFDIASASTFMEPPTSSQTNPLVLGGPGIFPVPLDHIPVTVIGADRPGRAGRDSAETRWLF